MWADTSHTASAYRSDGRRTLRPELTWRGYPILQPDLLDLLISELDEDKSLHQSGWQNDSYSPFAVFKMDSHAEGAPLDEVISNADPNADDKAVGEEAFSVDLHAQEMVLRGTAPKLFTSPSSCSQSTHQEKMLFHHYVNHVAHTMMPYEDKRNPWISKYPAVASTRDSNEQRALFYAMLTQASFSLVHLIGADAAAERLAARQYALATSHVHASLTSVRRDYGCLQAAIMTLVMAEVCADCSQDDWLTDIGSLDL